MYITKENNQFMLLRTKIKCKNKNTRRKQKGKKKKRKCILRIHAKCLTMANKKTTNKQNLD